MCTRGIPTTCSSRILDGWLPPYDATVVDRLRQAGAVRHRQDQPRRVRHGFVDRELGVRADPQPARPQPGAGRLLGRQRGGGRRRLRTGRPRLRHRRLDPPAGRAVRRGRRQADLRRWSAGTGSSPSPAPSTRSARWPRRSPTPRCCSTSSPATTRAIRPRSTATAPSASALLDRGVEGLRVGIVTELASAEGMAADVSARLREAADALAGAGAKVDEVNVPAAIYGLSAYYLIAPAEASSNLARYDGVRYGHRVRRGRHRCHVRRHPGRRLRRRGQAAHHARHLRPFGRLLRRLLRTGPAGADPDHPATSTRPTSPSTSCWRRPRRRPRSSSGPRRPTRWPCTCPTSAPSRPTWPGTRR